MLYLVSIEETEVHLGNLSEVKNLQVVESWNL